MNHRLEGGCQVPIGAYALLEDQQLWLRGLVASPDGSTVLKQEVRGGIEEAEILGTQLAESLLAAGADTILKQVYDNA